MRGFVGDTRRDFGIAGRDCAYTLVRRAAKIAGSIRHMLAD